MSHVDRIPKKDEHAENIKIEVTQLYKLTEPFTCELVYERGVHHLNITKTVHQTFHILAQITGGIIITLVNILILSFMFSYMSFTVHSCFFLLGAS